MVIQIVALGLLVLIFLIGTWKPVHLGALALAAAFVVGTLMSGESFSEIMAGFPVSILVLLLGVTYLFSIARDSGVVDWIINRALDLVRGRIVLLPWVFFGLAVLLGSMGSPLTALALAPVAMIFAGRHKMDPVLMGLSVTLGGAAGGFAPTSLFGLIANGVSHDSGITTNPLLLFSAGIGFNLALMIVAFLLFGGPKLLKATKNLPDESPSGGTSTESVDYSDKSTGATIGDMSESEISGAAPTVTQIAQTESETVNQRLSGYQTVSLCSLGALILLVVTLSALGIPNDVGVIALALAVFVSLCFPEETKSSMKRVDWSTILLVGGIVTYVGVLERMGAIKLLGKAAESVSFPIAAAFVICLIGAAVSAFASTTGILGALIPLAIPLMATGSFTGYGLIVALAISANLVDTTPFSTAGATAIASAPEDARPRMIRILLRWGFSMILIGPIATVLVLILPSLA